MMVIGFLFTGIAVVSALLLGWIALCDTDTFWPLWQDEDAKNEANLR